MEEINEDNLTDDITHFGTETKTIEDNIMELGDWLRGGRAKKFYNKIISIWNPPFSRIFVVHYQRELTN
jgi:hypothetical protein